MKSIFQFNMDIELQRSFATILNLRVTNREKRQVLAKNKFTIVNWKRQIQKSKQLQ